MRRRWTRLMLVTGTASGVLLAAGVLLMPRQPEIAATAEASPVAATHALDAYVRRTTARLAGLPGDWNAWAHLGLAHLELARATADPAHYRLAETALTRSLTVHPADNSVALTGLGALAAARHDFVAALRHARRAVAADRYSADAYGVLTDAYGELGRYDEATAAAQRMLDLHPDTGSLGRASYLVELRGDIPRAEQLMTRALDLAADPAQATFALRHLGDLAFNRGDLATAAARYADGLARAPGDPALLAGRARVAAAHGDLAAARADLRTATAIRPATEYLTRLADVERQAGDAAAAGRTEDLIRVGDRLATGPAAADVDMVLFHADRGEGAAAVAAGAKLLASRPSVTVESAYAWALHSAGRNREALGHADRGLRLGTRDAAAHYQRGTIRLALGDEKGARADLTEALRINPYFSLRHGPDARAVLGRLGR